MLKYIAFFLLIAQACLAQELVYTVALHSTQTHTVQVIVELKKMGAKTVSYQMPIWAPGAYSVTHYGHYVTDFKAFDAKGKELAVTQANGDRWEISEAKNIAKISYLIGDSHKDSTSLYFALAHIDTNFFFANGTCLFGYVNDKKNIPAKVIYSFPDTWHIATALDPVSLDTASSLKSRPDWDEVPYFMATYKAKNYDELVDAPVMADTGLQIRSFNDGSASYDIVLASQKKFEMDSLEEYIHKIVHAETDFFHDTPFKHYTFLVYAPTYFNSPALGQGALEHANSSDYLLVNLPWKTFKTFGPEIFSHEFFHLWNVKRIHSSLLGPFDYTKRVMTTSLWLSEGITDYYAHTLLTRYGIMPYRTFEQMVKNLSALMNQAEAARSETLEQLSIDESDFALDKATIFYSKGTLVGLLLDIEIRSRTNNKKSLDDVMLALNDDAKKGITFKDSELIGKMEKITGLDLQNFYHKYIAGTDDLPLDEYLAKMGVGDTVNSNFSKMEAESTSNPDGSISIAGTFLHDLLPTSDKETLKDRAQWTFYRIQSEGTMIGDTIEVGDTLKTVNGEPFTVDKLGEIGKNFKRPVSYELEVVSPSLNKTGSESNAISPSAPLTVRRKHIKLVYDVQDTPKHTPKYAPLPNATPLQVAIRHGIVGMDY
jgi:predicted metalloprotease with PDZ domain